MRSTGHLHSACIVLVVPCAAAVTRRPRTTTVCGAEVALSSASARTCSPGTPPARQGRMRSELSEIGSTTRRLLVIAGAGLENDCARQVALCK